jgi:Amt family ammonium transporter
MQRTGKSNRAALIIALFLGPMLPAAASADSRDATFKNSNLLAASDVPAVSAVSANLTTAVNSAGPANSASLADSAIPAGSSGLAIQTAPTNPTNINTPAAPTAAPTTAAAAAIAAATATPPMTGAAGDVAAAHSASNYSLNVVWTLIAGFLVMFMQAGFALVETGMTRAKNVGHTMSMNLMVYALSMCGFFVCGYAFMMGGINGVPAGAAAPPIGGPASLDMANVPVLNHMLSIPIFGHPWGLLGFSGFFLTGKAINGGALVLFFYMMVFMDTAATIPTGALAERWSFRSFTAFSVCVGAFMYSVYGCWMWGGGWLAELGLNCGLGHGAVDYAGSSVVHLQGGVWAAVTAYLIGPRIGKYDVMGNPKPIFGHHMPMVVLGTFILAFGWFGFNAGSSMCGTDDRIGNIAVNTMLASGAASVAACFYMWKLYGKPDPSMMCNGMLGGLVAITAPCAFVSPMAAFFIGALAGVLCVYSVLFWERIGVDDPVGAISVHAVCGLWGLLAVGLFADGAFGEGFNGVPGTVKGLFYGDGKQLIAQLIAAVVCIAWNIVIGGAVFLTVGKYVRGGNRVSPEVEVAGLDIPEMGAPGYPEFITQTSMEVIS